MVWLQVEVKATIATLKVDKQLVRKRECWQSMDINGRDIETHTISLVALGHNSGEEVEQVT